MRGFIILAVFTIATVSAISAQSDNTNAVTVKGWVLDSACAYTKGLSKPVSASCARTCAKNGSPLVLLRDDGTIFVPIDNKTPAASQNPKLMPYAGRRVSVHGIDYVRNGSHAIVIGSISSLTSK